MQAVIAKLPPLECPPTYTRWYFLVITWFKYSMANFWLGIGNVCIISKSSCQPTIESSVPSNATNIVPFDIVKQRAWNCVVSFIIWRKWWTIISWYLRAVEQRKNVSIICRMECGFLRIFWVLFFLKYLRAKNRIVISSSPSIQSEKSR